jgi:pyridoxamine 5'-phosphate oxidase family protein
MAFTDAELDYLAGQPLGRVATAQPNGTLQVSPVGFRFNSRTNTIDIGGHGMARSRKFRNVADNGRVAFVVDDLASVNPWRPRGLEIRGHAEAIADPTDSAYGADTPRRLRRGDHPDPSQAPLQLRRQRHRSRRPAARGQQAQLRRLIPAADSRRPAADIRRTAPSTLT